MKRSIPILVLLLAVVAGAVGWLLLRGRSTPARRPNIVLISIDTCRADYLSCYGRFKRTTPHIDALARESALFSNVISPVPLTLPAHSSMLTGTIPPYHGVHDNIHYRLAEYNVTLAERLREQGYQTAAVVGAFVLHSKFGLNQGFDSYDDRLDSDLTFMGGYPERRAQDVTRAANEWLDDHCTEPFFLFLHYFDPHHPYRPPEPFATIFADNLYAGEVAYTDASIGKVIDKLKSLGLYDSSLLIITADHGESLGEHGETQHGYFVYHSTTRVPLIIKPSARHEPRRIDKLVALVDIVPTVLAQVGLPVPSDLRGRDLSPLLAGAAPEDDERYVYSESLMATKYGCSSLLAVETQHWKYIQTTLPEVYDLLHDPDESNNLLSSHAQRAGRMQAGLRTILQENLRAGGDQSRVVLDEKSLERLRQLGYTGGAVVESFEFDTTKQDPKGFLELFTKIEAVDYYFKTGDLEQTRAICEAILAERSDVAYIHSMLGRIAVTEGNDNEAIARYTEALKLDPDTGEGHNDLGILLARRGRTAEARDHYERALRIALGTGVEGGDLDRALAAQGRISPLAVRVYTNLGNLFYRQGKVQDAVDAYRSAVKVGPADPNAWYQLSVALHELGKAGEAAKALGEVLQIDPTHQAARRALESAGGEPSPQTTP